MSDAPGHDSPRAWVIARATVTADNPGMHRRSREPLFWAFAAALVSLAWGLATPVWQGPDEPSHYAMVQWLAHHQAMPIFRREFGFSDELKASLIANDFERVRFNTQEKVRGWRAEPTGSGLSSRAPAGGGDVGNAAASYPPLYYVPAVITERAARSLDIAARLRLARLLNMMWAFAFGWFASSAAFRALPEVRSAARGIAAIAIAWPQCAFMSGVFSPDIALAAAYAWTLDIALAMVHDKRLHGPMSAGLLAGASLLIKQTAGWIPISLGLVALINVARSPAALRFARIRELLTLTVLAILAASPWLLHCLDAYGSLNPWTYKADTRLALSEALRQYFTLTSPTAQFGQFLGRFGWLDARLPRALESAVAVLALAGAAHSAWTQKKNPAWWTAVLVGVGGAAFTALGLIASGMASGFLFAPIGRYYAVFIAALALAFWTGPLLALATWARIRAGNILLVPVGIHVYALLLVLIPRYYRL